MNNKGKVITTIILGSALFLTACGNNSEEDTSSEDNAWNDIQEAGVLRAATSGTYYPNSYHDEETNELTGFEVEILREIGERLDLEVEFTEMGVDGMLTSLNSEQQDIAALSISHAGENADKFNYSIPYKYTYMSMIVREEDNSGIETMEDLDGKKAAGAATTSYMKIAEQYGAELVIYDNATNDQYLWDVANGRTDVIINDYYGQTMALKAFPEIPVKIQEDLFFNPSYTNFSMKLGNDQLTEAVDGALEDMHSDGTLSELSKEYFYGEDVTKEKDMDIMTIEIEE
ncbi:transporter substrate-binding domain-containing protein [Marinilactibacillus psychrotolerans]|uniref:Amino acid ABC transporter substrate-binding protein n=1 Tax=Marinilactibacillus psychrotolerans TaxID=191770 RepID=A0AAV3WQ56_9LACT|nr:transporter substrate-binding domain-containing protein [Marinilactibacillus psychrotolerans]GEL67147.1 putative ABC transporter extracellular-binding protein YckB [Marinilactibacillus psychrotolerans]GEQ35440.1 amino acid ABC transporter substrate-binding protein [Marinilactibacillus psychrotolerans]SDC88886.1 cystine transport system substrate-binding protein [Marinilactibacillus psychrotolerans]